MNYEKPFLSYEDRIEKLKNDYNLKVSDDKKLELELLKTISYYDLINGYKDCFMQNDKFQNEHIMDLFSFSFLDKKFQNLLFMYSIYVENIFKTKLANLIAENKGVEYSQYLDINKYSLSNPNRRTKLLQTLSDMTTVHSSSSDDPTKFYREKHNHIPPWILFKNVYFTTVIDIFSFLSKDEKIKLISEYPAFNKDSISEDEKIEMFRNMLTIVRKFRNKIAHNSKIVKVKLDKNSINLINLKKIDTFKILKNSDIKAQRGACDIFGMFISILYLLGTSVLTTLFLADTLEFIDSKNDILKSKVDKYLLDSNFPTNAHQRIFETYKSERKKLEQFYN